MSLVVEKLILKINKILNICVQNFPKKFHVSYKVVSDKVYSRRKMWKSVPRLNKESVLMKELTSAKSCHKHYKNESQRIHDISPYLNVEQMKLGSR